MEGGFILSSAKKYIPRLFLLFIGVSSLLLALWLGLIRLGWKFPIFRVELLEMHGPLMVGGFLGVLIGLERAVALDKSWAYLAPLSSALGILAALVGAPLLAVKGLFLLSSSLLFLVLIFLARRQVALFTVTIAGGSALWVVGNILWLSNFSIRTVALWWMAFLLVTVVGERLEISRIVIRKSEQKIPYNVGLILFIFSLISQTSGVPEGISLRLLGVSLLVLGYWLYRYDIYRANLRREGAAKYTAVCMAVGYFWLFVAGGIFLYYGGMPGFAYDAALHSVFMGFLFAMIFGHSFLVASILFGFKLNFYRTLYLSLFVLEGATLLRVVGDLFSIFPLRTWGGIISAVAVVSYPLFLILGSLWDLLSRRNSPERV